MSGEKTNLAGLHVLLGVSGGIAAYKAVDLASKLTAAGAKVHTVMTENACRFVDPRSFEAVTRSRVYTSLWSTCEEYKASHISLAQWLDVAVVAPATADIIGKIANGICDDLLSTTLCVCWQQPVLLAPAMNDKMWNNPAIQRNVETIKKMGFHLTGPQIGPLACGTDAIGRMSEPGNILTVVEKIASQLKKKTGDSI